VAARNSSSMHFPTANAAAFRLVDRTVYEDQAIYPTAEQRAHLHAMGSHSLAFERELSRTWTRFKTGH
jgi:putrescine transport system substrate-binding protein